MGDRWPYLSTLESQRQREESIGWGDPGGSNRLHVDIQLSVVA